MKRTQANHDLFLVRALRSVAAAGVPFADGFEEWAAHLPAGVAGEKTKAAGDLIRRGRSVSEALRQSAFPASGSIVRILDGLERNPAPVAFLGAIEAQLLEEEDARRKIREVIVYPAFLLVGMTIVIVIFALTMMEAVYDQGWEHQRPVFYFLYSVLHPVRLLLVLLIPAVAVAAIRFLGNPMLLPIPGVKRLFLEAQRATFCQFLQLEFTGRRTVEEALESAALSFPPEFREELLRAAGIAREGLPLDEDQGLLLAPQIRYYMNRSGAGQELIATLEKLKGFYQEQSRLYAVSLQRSTEVLALIILGVLVGFVLIECFDFYYGYVIGSFPF